MLLTPFRSGQWRALRLERGRVMLRPAQQKDWKAWSQLRLESREFLTPWEPSWPYDALTRGAFRRRLRVYNQEMRQGSSFSFLIFKRGRREVDEELIGGVTLSNVRRGVAQTGSLVYWIGGRFARQGYMTEALSAVLDFAFGNLGLHRVDAACLPRNAASRALLAKLGFQEEGYAREYLRINGAWQDHVLYAILHDDVRGEGEE
ncbi:MAG: GNAT family N-acetyltransferase [Kiloniellales bacterium]